MADANLVTNSEYKQNANLTKIILFIIILWFTNFVAMVNIYFLSTYHGYIIFFMICKCVPTPTWSIDPGQPKYSPKVCKHRLDVSPLEVLRGCGAVRSMLARWSDFLARKRTVESCPQLPPAWRVCWSDCRWGIPSDLLPHLQKIGSLMWPV